MRTPRPTPEGWLRRLVRCRHARVSAPFDRQLPTGEGQTVNGQVSWLPGHRVRAAFPRLRIAPRAQWHGWRMARRSQLREQRRTDGHAPRTGLPFYTPFAWGPVTGSALGRECADGNGGDGNALLSCKRRGTSGRYQSVPTISAMRRYRNTVAGGTLRTIVPMRSTPRSSASATDSASGGRGE